MISEYFDEADLRYMQCRDFVPGPLQPWIRPRNPFAVRMAANLRPGFAVKLDLQTLVDVLGGAAHARPGMVINVSLQLHAEWGHMVICSIEQGMPSICADDAGNLLRALRWYHNHGETWLHVSLIAPSFFWLPRHLLARSPLDEPAGSNH